MTRLIARRAGCRTAAVLLALAVSGAARADLRFADPVVSAGEVRTGAALSHRFTFVNRGAAPATIAEVRSSCGCMKPRLEPDGTDLPHTCQPGDEGSLLLQSFVWADQTERLERLRAAIDVVRADPPELIRGDYVSDLPRLLRDRVPGAQLVVYETASTQYLDSEQRAALHNAMHDAGRKEPVTFLTTRSHAGADCYTLEAWAWPSGERSEVERFDFHGSWLEWLS